MGMVEVLVDNKVVILVEYKYVGNSLRSMMSLMGMNG